MLLLPLQPDARYAGVRFADPFQRSWFVKIGVRKVFLVEELMREHGALNGSPVSAAYPGLKS